MDRAPVEHLPAVKDTFTQGEECIVRQRELIQRFKSHGHDTLEACRLLGRTISKSYRPGPLRTGSGSEPSWKRQQQAKEVRTVLIEARHGIEHKQHRG